MHSFGIRSFKFVHSRECESSDRLGGILDDWNGMQGRQVACRVWRIWQSGKTRRTDNAIVTGSSRLSTALHEMSINLLVPCQRLGLESSIQILPLIALIFKAIRDVFRINDSTQGWSKLKSKTFLDPNACRPKNIDDDMWLVNEWQQLGRQPQNCVLNNHYFSCSSRFFLLLPLGRLK